MKKNTVVQIYLSHLNGIHWFKFLFSVIWKQNKICDWFAWSLISTVNTVLDQKLFNYCSKMSLPWWSIILYLLVQNRQNCSFVLTVVKFRNSAEWMMVLVRKIHFIFMSHSSYVINSESLILKGWVLVFYVLFETELLQVRICGRLKVTIEIVFICIFAIYVCRSPMTFLLWWLITL